MIKTMMKRVIALLLAMLATVTTSAFAEQTVGSVTLRYNVKANGVTLGEVRHTVEINQNRYTITSVERARGIVGLFANQITRESRGTIVNQRFRPTTYSETIRGRASRVARLNWTTMTATFTTDESKVATFNANTVDRATFPYQYYLAQKAPPSGTYKQTVVDVKRAEEQQFRNGGKETINTPMGRIEAIRLERTGTSSSMKMWLSPAHGYLPVRIMFMDDKGNVLDQLIVEIVKGETS